MTRIELMQSMISLNEALNNRRLGFFERACGVLLMSLQTKEQLERAEFSLRAYVINVDSVDK